MKTTAVYKTYTTWELVLDDDFIRWVKAPDISSTVFWEQFLANFPEKAATVQEARELLLHYHFEPALVDAAVTERIWQQLQQQYATVPQRPRGLLRMLPRRSWQYAAAVFVLLMAGIFSYRYFSAASTVVATHAGEIRRITFPGGAQIVLNQHSRLSYSSRHPGVVNLEGEAYFSIPKQSHAPSFLVRCAKGAIQVLGTSFNVKAQQQQLKVVLEQGAVQVTPADPAIHPVKMQPGELVVMDAGGLRSKRVNTQWHTAWRSNQLIFTDAPVEDILAYLADTYEWHFIIRKPVTLTDKRFNGTAPANDPGLLLEKISTIYQLRIERRADTVFLLKKMR